MNDLLSLSIIIPIYKAEGYIGQLFDTLKSQGVLSGDTSIQSEIIFVDDGSPDRSVDMIRHYAESYDNIRIVRQENQGQGEARNHGLREARMEYVYMMDQDDILAPDTLIPHVILAAKENADIVRFRFEIIERYEVESVRNTFSENSYPVNVTHRLTGKDYIRLTDGLKFEITVWTSIIRRQLLIDNNLYFERDVRHREDEIFSWRLMLKVEKLILTDRQGYYWIQDPASDSHNQSVSKNHDRHRNLEIVARHLHALEHADRRTENDLELRLLIQRSWKWHEFTYWVFLIKRGNYGYDDIRDKINRHYSEGLLPLPGKMNYTIRELGLLAVPFGLIWLSTRSKWFFKKILWLRTKFRTLA